MRRVAPLALLLAASGLALVAPFVPSGPAASAAPYAFVGSWLLYKITDAIIPLRVSERQELIGLDITQHEETVSSRGVRAAVEAIQGELDFGVRSRSET